MKQHGDQHWSGHRELTRDAVHRLFEGHAGRDGRIRGLAEQEYFNALDRAQAYQDRALGAGLIRNFDGTGRTVPYADAGSGGVRYGDGSSTRAADRTSGRRRD